MSITVQPASGKPRVIVMDEAGLAALIMDAADALAAMAAASAVLAPAGEHPYPEPLPRREPGAGLAAAQDAAAADDGEVLFLPERAAELLANPPSVMGAVRGEVTRRSEIMFRTGNALAGPADLPELIAAIGADKARLIRMWDIDWTGDEPFATNMVQCAGDGEFLAAWAAPDPEPELSEGQRELERELRAQRGPSGDGGEPPAPAELTEDEARQPCDRKACGHERGHHAKGTEECAHGCGCAAYLLPMPAPAAATETEDAP